MIRRSAIVYEGSLFAASENRVHVVKFGRRGIVHGQGETAKEQFTVSGLILDGNQLNFEDERRVRPNHIVRAALAIGQL
jgi:hypothetical protein